MALLYLILGVIELDNKRQPPPIDQRHQHLLIGTLQLSLSLQDDG